MKFEVELTVKKDVTVKTNWQVYQNPPCIALNHGYWNFDFVRVNNIGKLSPEYTAYLDGGNIVYRGQTVSNLRVEIRFGLTPYVTFRDGFNPLTEGFRNFLKANLEPVLLNFITANRAELERQAIDGLDESMSGSIRDLRKLLDHAELEKNALISNLHANLTK